MKIRAEINERELKERMGGIGSVANLQHFVTVREFTDDVLGQWSDLA